MKDSKSETENERANTEIEMERAMNAIEMTRRQFPKPNIPRFANPCEIRTECNRRN